MTWASRCLPIYNGALRAAIDWFVEHGYAPAYSEPEAMRIGIIAVLHSQES